MTNESILKDYVEIQVKLKTIKEIINKIIDDQIRTTFEKFSFNNSTFILKLDEFKKEKNISLK